VSTSRFGLLLHHSLGFSAADRSFRFCDFEVLATAYVTSHAKQPFPLLTNLNLPPKYTDRTRQTFDTGGRGTVQEEAQGELLMCMSLRVTPELAGDRG